MLAAHLFKLGENISNTEPNSVPVLQYCPFTTNSECTYYFLVIDEGSWVKYDTK